MGRRKCIGAKHVTEDAGGCLSHTGQFIVLCAVYVRGRRAFLTSCEGRSVRATGASRSENVGMSNHNHNEKLRPQKSKVSVALAINHGLVGPKAMAKAAAEWTAG